MAEELLPTISPGMVGLRNKKTKAVTAHFPVDVREIMEANAGEYEIVENGAVEAARLSATPLKLMQNKSDLTVAEVTGIEGQVMVAMSPEQAEAWKTKMDSTGPDSQVVKDTEAGAESQKPVTEPEKAAPSAKTEPAKK